MPSRRGPGQSPNPAQIRIACIAVLAGAFVFAVAVPILLSQNEGKGFADPPVPMLEWIAVGMAGVVAVMGFVMRGVIQRRAEGGDAEARAQANAQAALMGIALLEGGILFNLVVWMLNATLVPNAVAATVLFLLAMTMLPSGEPEV